MITKKIGALGAAGAAALMGMAPILGGCTDNAIYKEGTYTGTGEGKGGPITATVTFDSKSITAVELVGEDESPGVGGYECIKDGTFASRIIEAQSTDIDGVTGATQTTEGVKSAVQDAIDQATIKK